MPPEIAIDGKRRCAKHDRAARLFIMAAAGALLTGNAAFSRQIVLPEHKSIHQIESEAHCDFVPRSVKTGRRMLSLSPSQPPNRTRTVFGFYPYRAPGFSELRFRDLTHLAVFSAEASGSGQWVNLRGWPNGPLIQAAHDANVRVVLVCTLFSAGQLDILLSSPGARQALIGNI